MLHHAEARLELLAAIAHEARPVLRARNQLREQREHLAAVADAERKRIAAREELRELAHARARATGSSAPSRRRRRAHRRRKTRRRRSARGTARACAARSSRSVMCTSCASKPARSSTAAISIWLLTPCSRSTATRGRAPRAISGAAMSSSGSKLSCCDSPGSDTSSMRGEFLLGALRIVAQPAHVIGGLRPRAAQIGPALIEQLLAGADAHAQLRLWRTDALHAMRPARARARHSSTIGSSGLRHLQHRARLLGEQRTRSPRRQPPAAPTSRPQWPANAISTSVTSSSAIGAIVIGQQPARARAAR